MWCRSLFSILFALIFVYDVSKSCTQIVIDGGESGNIDWLNGVFDVDKEQRVDDRLVYKERNGSRVIYHYSGPTNSKEQGRWLLGSIDTIGTDNGWAYRYSWSISPDDLNIDSLHNTEQTRQSWRVFIGENWVDVEDIHFRCRSIFGDYDAMNDLLFITTDDLFEDRDLTFQNIHGFYIRISDTIFTKISGSKRIFFQEGEKTSELFAITDESTLQDNGLPPIKSPTNGKLVRTNTEATWNLITSDGRTLSNIHLVVLQPTEDNNENENANANENENDDEDDERRMETIYELMRRYYIEHKIEHRSKDIQVSGLNNGMSFPMIGLGTGGLNGMNENYRVIKEAVTKYDYAAIDSASSYESEAAIGTLLTENKTLRSQLFLTSKVWPTDLYFDATLESVQKTLDAMKINYVDLYMIHWPMCYNDLPFVDCSQSKDGQWQQAYEALIKLNAEGVVLCLGISNWDEQLLDELTQDFAILPQVLQNHIDLVKLDWDFYDIVRDHKILLQAYSPLRGLVQAKDPEQIAWTETLEQLSQEIEESQGVKVSFSQLVLRFLVENDIAVIPMSTKSQHLKDNNDLFHFQFTPDFNIRLGGREVEKQEL